MLNKHSDGRAVTFKNKIDRFVNKSSSSNKAELQKWLLNGTMKDANSALKKVLYVRTILSTRDELNLLDFYYPSMFNHKSNKLSIEDVLQSPSTQPSLIVGTVGQGKSIALRYLAFYTLCKLPSIPIFLELRKLRSSTSLLEHVRQSLEKIKLKCSEKLLKHLLSNGEITLFLDGFDEIKHEKRIHWVDEIEQVYVNHPMTKIFVTSRPDTDIHHHHLFMNYQLTLLEETDRPNFIKKLVKKTEDQTALIVKLASASNGVNELLTTPLLMALFVSVYQNRRKLPNSNSEFFDELFSTILSRHDGLKAAYDRPSKANFTDKELKLALQSLAYQTRKSKLRQLPELKLIEIATLALNAVGFDSSKSEEFIYDVNNITCILQKDGLEHRFIHDSVQEFYSASFVRDQEEAKQDFYTKYFDNWHHWSPEFHFLKYIDEVAYNKYFLIPSFKNLCEIGENNSLEKIKKASFIEILHVTDIALYTSTKEQSNSKLKFVCFASRESLSNWASELFCKFTFTSERHEFHNRIEKEFALCIAKNVNDLATIDVKEAHDTFKIEKQRFYVFNSHQLLSKYKLVDHLYKSIDNDALYNISKSYSNAVTFVEKKKNVGGVF